MSLEEECPTKDDLVSQTLASKKSVSSLKASRSKEVAGSSLKASSSKEVAGSSNETAALYLCDVCNANYKTFGRYANHMQKKHDEFVSETFYCNKCNTYFETVKQFNRHKKSHV